MDIRKHWRIAFILALIIVGIFYREEAGKVLETIAHAPIWLFFAALGLVVIEFVLQAVRFWLVFRKRFSEVLRVYAVGHFVAFSFPSRTLGEGARVAAFAKELGVSGGDAAAYVSIERLTDVAVITATASFILVSVNPVLAGAIAGFIVMSFFLIESDTVYGKLIEKNLPDWLRDYIERSRAIVKDRKKFLVILLLTVVLWAVDFYRMWLITVTMGGRVDYITVAALTSVAYILAAVSFLPGGLGAYEGGLAGGLVLHGVPYDIAIAATLYERFFSYWLWIVVGALAGVRSGSSSGASPGQESPAST